ncbi:MAG: type VI secretion system tube protein Hcp [Burkholderiales bacterium]|nr:type VI secretion system tube protein Hcp [Burkholderiales bacterium]
MAAALNAFMEIGEAKGESKQEPYVGWIELQAWDWEVEAETSWTKGGGAAVGKPSPGKMNWEHSWNRASNILLTYICTGKSFPEIKLEMCKATGSKGRQKFFTVLMKEAFITKVNQSATDEGNVLQKVEMVFKSIEIEYFQQGMDPKNPGQLRQAGKFDWDIPAGVAHPDSGG